MCAGSCRVEDYIQALNCQLHCLNQHHRRKLSFVGENQKEKRGEYKQKADNEPIDLTPFNVVIKLLIDTLHMMKEQRK